MRKGSIRSLASILIWVGSVEIVSSFFSKMILHYPIPYSSAFFGCILAGILLLVLVRI